MQLSELKAKKCGQVMTWHGQTSHRDVGYDSRDPRIVDKQIAKMYAIGIEFARVSWQGQAYPHNQTGAVQFMRGCERAEFPFFIQIDKSAQKTADEIKQMQDVFFSSPQYYRVNGRPLVATFDPLAPAALDALSTEALLIYRNASGLDQPRSEGCFQWPDTTGDQTAGTDYFNGKTQLCGKLVMHCVSPGFTGASWNVSNPNFRPTPYRYGQEWQDSLRRVPEWSQYVCVATWNDHEEGTGIEFMYL